MRVAYAWPMTGGRIRRAIDGNVAVETPGWWHCILLEDQEITTQHLPPSEDEDEEEVEAVLTLEDPDADWPGLGWGRERA